MDDRIFQRGVRMTDFEGYDNGPTFCVAMMFGGKMDEERIIISLLSTCQGNRTKLAQNARMTLTGFAKIKGLEVLGLHDHNQLRQVNWGQIAGQWLITREDREMELVELGVLKCS